MSCLKRKWKTTYTCQKCKSSLYFTRLQNYWCNKCNEVRNYYYLPTDQISVIKGNHGTRYKTPKKRRGRPKNDQDR